MEEPKITDVEDITIIKDVVNLRSNTFTVDTTKYTADTTKYTADME